MSLTFGSVFSGGMCGATEAAKYLGIEALWYCEIDPICQQLLRKRYGDDIVIYNDVRTMLQFNPDAPDILFITSPCQSFSLSGNNKGFDDPNGQLLYDAIKLVDVLRPKYFVLENSPNMPNFREFTTGVLAKIAQMGYDAEWGGLPLTAFGFPTKRERFLLLAWQSAIISPDEIGRQILLQEPAQIKGIVEEWQTTQIRLSSLINGLERTRDLRCRKNATGLFQ